MKKSTNTGLKPPSELQRKTRTRNMNLLKGLIPSRRCLHKIDLELLTKEEQIDYHEAVQTLSKLINNYSANNFEFGIRSKIHIATKVQYVNVIKFMNTKESYGL